MQNTLNFRSSIAAERWMPYTNNGSPRHVLIKGGGVTDP